MKKLITLCTILFISLYGVAQNYRQLAETAMQNHPSPIDFSDPFQGGNATLVPGNQQFFATAVDDPWLHPYVDVFKGANGGWDVCCTVDPAQSKPGMGEIDAHLGGREPVSQFTTGGFTDYETKGDLFILGDYKKPYYAGKNQASDPENDFVYLYRFDEDYATIRLHGKPSDYKTATAYNPETQEEGMAIFYIANKTDDLIGFVDGVDSLDLLLNSSRFIYDTAPIENTSLQEGRQISTGGINVFGRIAIDIAGNIYQTFLTSGSSLPGSSGTGSFYVVKYDKNYNILWAKKHGSIPDGLTNYGECPYNISVNDKYVFISGQTKGDFGGPAIIPSSDKVSVPFIAKFDVNNGNLLAIKRLYDTNENSTAWNCVVDKKGEFVYVGGGTTANGVSGLYPHTSPFIKKLRQSDLSQVWSDTIISGTNPLGINPNFRNISIESFARPYYWEDATGKGYLYVGGYSSNGNFLNGLQGATNAWIGLYDTNGKRLWAEAFYSPTGHQYPHAIAVDQDGNAYVVGQTYSSMTNAMGGATPQGLGDGFIRKYDITGRHLWTKLIGTPQSDDIHDIQIADNKIFVTGSTHGNLNGANQGMVDGFMMSLDLNGNIIGSYQFGTEKLDYTRDILYQDGKLIVSGITEGSLIASFNGGMDVFIAAFDQNVLSTTTTATSLLNQSEQIQVFPNPSSGIFEIITSEVKNIAPAIIYNLQGKIIKTLQINNSATQLDLSELPDGVYILNISLSNETFVTKLVKQ